MPRRGLCGESPAFGRIHPHRGGHAGSRLGSRGKARRQNPSAAHHTRDLETTDEAARYGKLGQGCLDNQLFEDGAGALESALALCDNSRTTRMLQVKAYSFEAYPDDLRSVYLAADNFRIAKLEPSTMPLRGAAATRAAEPARNYLKANAAFQPGTKWDPEDPVDLSVETLNTSLRILCAAYKDDYFQTHPDDFTAQGDSSLNSQRCSFFIVA